MCGCIKRAELPGILRTDVLSLRMLHMIEGLAQDWHRLDERIEALSSEIGALACKDPACDRLMSVPGIGPIISSAMVAAIGSGDVFAKGRDFAAWLGLVPKQISTRAILGRISKRGNRYLRAPCLFRQPGSCWSGLGQALGATGSNPGSKQRKRSCTITCWRFALANKLAASPGRFSTNVTKPLPAEVYA
jgi:transposase